MMSSQLTTATRRLLATQLTKTTTTTITNTTTRLQSTKALAQIQAEEESDSMRAELEDQKSSVQKYVEKTRKTEPHMVWGTTIAPPEPELPSNVSEVAALDPAHMNQDPINPATGEKRIVTIMQEEAKVNQAPFNVEKQWIISFQNDGELSQCWDNPLMGWVSSADTMANSSRLQMAFRNAKDAVYFAKKRGWDYEVKEPIVRYGRADDAQYQDNFLPQSVAKLVRKEKKSCRHWEREASGTSHYFRPLTYHGDGRVSQHGPNGDKEIDPHPEGYYKMR